MQIQALNSGTGVSQALYSTGTGAARSTQAAAESSLKMRASSASGGSSSSSSSSSIKDYTYDVMDLNKDGYVSFLERVLYLITHPGTSASSSVQSAAGTSDDLSSAVSSYTSQGTTVEYTSQTEPLVDLFV